MPQQPSYAANGADAALTRRPITHQTVLARTSVRTGSVRAAFPPPPLLLLLPSSLAFTPKSLQLNYVRSQLPFLLLIPRHSGRCWAAGGGAKRGTVLSPAGCGSEPRCSLKMQNIKDLIYSRAAGAQELQLSFSSSLIHELESKLQVCDDTLNKRES